MNQQVIQSSANVLKNCSLWNIVLIAGIINSNSFWNLYLIEICVPRDVVEHYGIEKNKLQSHVGVACSWLGQLKKIWYTAASL